MTPIHATKNGGDTAVGSEEARSTALALAQLLDGARVAEAKELLRTIIEDVTIKVDRNKAAAQLTLRWKGGALNSCSHCSA